jgi:ribosomal protein S19
MRIIKNYDEALRELDLENQVVYNRPSRAKRSLIRLVRYVKESNPKSRNLLKQYYKIYKQDIDCPLKNLTRTKNGDIILLPFMIDKDVKLYNGKSYVIVKIKEEMIGRYLGEFIKTRTKNAHSSKGINPSKIKR